jgi:hypothetical protein
MHQARLLLKQFAFPNSKPRKVVQRNVKSMKSFLGSFIVAMIAAGMASCAQPTKPAALEKSSSVGSRFDGAGKVTLHAGQPCASQVMFDLSGKPSASRAYFRQMAARHAGRMQLR